MLARIFFYPTLGTNILMTYVTSRQWYNRIDDTVLVGALPFKSVTKQLIDEENVKAMVTMNEDYELKYFTYNKEELSDLGVEQLRLQVTDLTGTPSQENISTAVDFIMSHRQRGHSVYVHCKAGRTRSVTIAVCYLMQLHNWSPEESLAFVKGRRPHVWLRKKQLASVQGYYDSHIMS
ncbi:phosphatidylglycerophosphatase and protein-tyrosine phosphatase 1 [Aplysia californica]|uniref:Phosphatidylglycerophosphatase and protein-tyrosine phosphatase 1 n=1 Tax=Aplysia californica TaxID=6500 RepID=A0ABM0JWR2_APLCA|nr:phosphatidylglycerophosphatase and protein-tyrosine phosphatase 1 [Aplysia californica]